MLGKRVAPVIGKLTRPSFSSSNRTAEKVGVVTSPRSPLDYVRIIHSPRGVNNYDVGGGVGLGIVAALEKSLDVGGGIGRDMIIQGNNKSSNCSRNLNNNNNRSNPIPVSTVRNCCGGGLRGEEEEEEEDVDSLEEYTFVTCRRPGNKSYTRVYYGGVERNRRGGGGGDEITELDRRNSKKIDHRRRRRSVFAISPETFGAESVTVSPPCDFLSSCHSCEKKLQGKDIYMYREKAFCSTECRYSQIVKDEYKEKCSTKVATKSADIAASSPYQNSQLFSTGILAI